MIKNGLKNRLISHLKELSRERDPYVATQGYYYARHYIQSQLESCGPAIKMGFTHQGRDHYNLCLNLPGQQSLTPVVIGAHYDTVPGSPGADDNTTGVAVLLELARLFVAQRPRRPVQLVAFDLEEYGLLGSQAYVRELQGELIHIMLSLEMLGYCAPGVRQTYPLAAMDYIYPKTADFIALVGNWQTIPTMMRLGRGLAAAGVKSAWLPVVNRGLPLPTTRRSDHSPFWDAGYNALMVTDTADLRNPHYHQRTDTVDTLDLDFLTGICVGLHQTIARI